MFLRILLTYEKFFSCQLSLKREDVQTTEPFKLIKHRKGTFKTNVLMKN